MELGEEFGGLIILVAVLLHIKNNFNDGKVVGSTSFYHLRMTPVPPGGDCVRMRGGMGCSTERALGQPRLD